MATLIPPPRLCFIRHEKGTQLQLSTCSHRELMWLLWTAMESLLWPLPQHPIWWTFWRVSGHAFSNTTVWAKHSSLTPFPSPSPSLPPSLPPPRLQLSQRHGQSRHKGRAQTPQNITPVMQKVRRRKRNPFRMVSRSSQRPKIPMLMTRHSSSPTDRLAVLIILTAEWC